MRINDPLPCEVTAAIGNPDGRGTGRFVFGDAQVGGKHADGSEPAERSVQVQRCAMSSGAGGVGGGKRIR